MAQVLIVDDQPDGAAASIAGGLASQGIQVDVYYPTDITESALRGVDLLLVDYDLKEWDQSDIPPSNVCASGWSLAGVLRDRSRELDCRNTPTVTALLTSKIDSATVPFTSAGRSHIAAELNGLEWVFDKTSPELYQQLTILAGATVAVQREWTVEDLMKALDVADGDSSARRDVLRCRPPLSESLVWEDGLGFLRWMMHRVLPYPTFLIDEFHLSARLGIATSDMARLRENGSAIASALREHVYSGVLANFTGVRWWRAGIDALLWELTEGRPSDTRFLQRLVSETLDGLADPIELKSNSVVVCYDESLRPVDRPVDVSIARRIWPDDWPPFASQPWATCEAIENSSSLRRLASPLGDSGV